MITSLIITHDKNGNSILRVKVRGHRTFSVQTNGNLPDTHRLGLFPRTIGELHIYVNAHGTKAQRAALLALR